MIQEQREAVQQEEEDSLAPEIAAFCSLIARIVMRCLRQHDTRLEQFLFPPDQSEQDYTGGKHEPTTTSSGSSQTSSALREALPTQAPGRDRRTRGAARPLHRL